MSSPLGATPMTAVRFAVPPTGPAIFVERRPVGVLAGAQHSGSFIAGLVSVPRPAHPNPSIDCATSLLHLPLDDEVAPELHGIPGRAGVECLWARDDSWLLVPSYVLEELAFERAWNVGLLTTPSSIGCPYPGDWLAQAAWMVIAAAPAAHVVRLLGGVAALLDDSMDSVAVSVELARLVQPGEMAGPLLAAARAGETWLYGRCLRWIVRERLMAALMGNLCPHHCPPPWELVAAMFPSLTGGHAPTDADLLRAAWFLHDSFIGSGIDEGSSLEDAARVTAALTYGSARPGNWLARLAAWSSIWSVDDAHSVAATPQGWGGPRPSELRAKATHELGMPVDAWYGAVTAILTSVMLSHAGGTPVLASRHGSDSISLEIERGEVIVVDASRAVDNILAHGAVTVDELAASVAQDAGHAGRSYRGYGTLPQHEANATRRHPVVVFPDGSWIITDVGAFAEWAADLPLRLLHGSAASGRRSPARSTAGLMFEGYVVDQLDRLTDRHRVTPGRALDAVVPKKSQRPDGLVANNDGHGGSGVQSQAVARRHRSWRCRLVRPARRPVRQEGEASPRRARQRGRPIALRCRDSHRRGHLPRRHRRLDHLRSAAGCRSPGARPGGGAQVRVRNRGSRHAGRLVQRRLVLPWRDPRVAAWTVRSSAADASREARRIPFPPQLVDS